MRFLKILALSAVLPISASAQSLILNGGFDDGSPGGASVGTTVDTSTIANWNLQTSSGASTFTVFAAPGLNEPNPADGDQLLNIGGFGSGKGVGLLWQDFSTTIGMTYDVAFSFGRSNNNDDSQNVSVDALVYNIESGSISGGALANQSSGNAPAAGVTGDLTEIIFQFTATGTTSRLLFDDTTVSTAPSLHLDGISVISAVPEPEETALAAGLALLWWAAWRKRRGRAGAAAAH